MKLSVFDNDISYRKKVFFHWFLQHKKSISIKKSNVRLLRVFFCSLKISEGYDFGYGKTNGMRINFFFCFRMRAIEKKRQPKENTRNIFWRKDDKEKGVCRWRRKKTHDQPKTHNLRRFSMIGISSFISFRRLCSSNFLLLLWLWLRLLLSSCLLCYFCRDFIKSMLTLNLIIEAINAHSLSFSQHALLMMRIYFYRAAANMYEPKLSMNTNESRHTSRNSFEPVAEL